MSFDRAKRHREAAELAIALCELPEAALWAVGDMEEGPFARLCWPMPGGGYGGGYFEAVSETPAKAMLMAIDKAKAGAGA